MLTLPKVRSWKGALAFAALVVGFGMLLWFQGETDDPSLVDRRGNKESPRRLVQPRQIIPTEEGVEAIFAQAGLEALESSSGRQSDGPAKRAPMDLILGESELDIHERVSQLENLDLPLDEGKLDAIYAFLEESAPPTGMGVEEWRWLTDAVFTLLRNDGGDDARYVKQLESMFRNLSGDPFIRDYAVQHLGHLLKAGHDPSEILPVMRAAVAETGNTIAGSALLALDQNYPGDQETAELAFRLASDPATHLASRVTALQVTASQQMTEALPLVLGIANDSSQPVPLRLSAIAALGTLGGNQHQGALNILSRSRNHLIRAASNSALQRLAQKNR